MKVLYVKLNAEPADHEKDDRIRRLEVAAHDPLIVYGEKAAVQLQWYSMAFTYELLSDMTALDFLAYLGQQDYTNG